MFELKQLKHYLYFQKQTFHKATWTLLRTQTPFPTKQLVTFLIREKSVFSCFSEAEKEINVYETESGVYFLAPTALVFVTWDASSLIVKPRTRIWSLVQGAEGELYGLGRNVVFSISHAFASLAKRVFTVPKLHKQISEQTRLVSAARHSDYMFLSTTQKLFILSISTHRLVQSFMIFEGILGIHASQTQVILSTHESQFEILKFGSAETAPIHSEISVNFDAETTIALTRNEDTIPTDPLDLLWGLEMKRDAVQIVKSLWHLEPLDRTYLRSKDFYQEHLYHYMDSLVKCSTFTLYFHEPGALRLLREALREQEQSLRQDGLLNAEETISSFLLACLPPMTPSDTLDQVTIREELGSKSRTREERLEVQGLD